MSVEGDRWSFWGIEEDECTEDDKVVIDEECKWVDFAYMGYLEHISNCLYSDNNPYDSSVIDYRNESWYKCAYSTSKEEVLDFITRIEHADSVMDEERIMYRKRVISNLDGNVCDRIYDYFKE